MSATYRDRHVRTHSVPTRRPSVRANANLGWKYVTKVEVRGFGQAMDGIITSQVDAAFTSTISGKSFQIESSPRGIAWPTVPHGDAASWKRLKAHAPFYVPFMEIGRAHV